MRSKGILIIVIAIDLDIFVRAVAEQTAQTGNSCSETRQEKKYLEKAL